ncbi:protein-glutamate O-methyltransferase CheR [Thiospirochaeta perfilievii]|uniref:Protein-glutamate O-methyltransferase CheR n=1 Tax=Thiospirochaeta perfilievii TaxID=252967 RepID=A0A5C1QC66_9SPIO|nr:protein-glutamate O-methyltransferase CheR [Thiospirochaeta perfilievii]QEN04928.1 protein-glutamate O-methyltransferase CheR [Thiospirochaeta perfilievii]
MESDRELVENEDIEVELVLDALLKKSDYDYRNYSRSHIKRRLSHRLTVSGYNRYSDMIPDIIYNPQFLNKLLSDLSINVTEMFRDPSFFLELKDKIFPYIKTYPFVKIWHAGCSSGQEVYSMAILLSEDNLYEKSQIYATDFNREILDVAKRAIYPIDTIKKYTNNYQQGGGQNSFADYYIADYDSAAIIPSLKKNVLFSFHNLVTDGIFGEMHVIVCRNVLIYFDKELQNSVLKLFYESLVPGGFLCLGSKESIRFSEVEKLFEVVSSSEKIFRKRVC